VQRLERQQRAQILLDGAETGDRFFDGAKIGAMCLIQRRERPGLQAQPRLVALGPRVFRARESTAMPQEELRQAMARAQQVRANIFTAAEYIAGRFFLLVGM
jgi:hypothetical protein